MWIDTHCHLTSEGLLENVGQVIARANKGGVRRMITVGTHVEDHAKVMRLVGEYPQVFGALGIHPHHAAEAEAGFEGFLENLLRGGMGPGGKIVALGECGLDYHYDYSPKLLQRGVFLNQLEMARRLDVPVILHVREAHAEALAMVRDFPELRFVVHCFTGTPVECAAWVELGAYIGITGIVTYKNAADVQASAKLVPADRLLVETDAPFLSPEPVRKGAGKKNESVYVVHTGAYVAGLRGVEVGELARTTTENAGRLFGERLVGVGAGGV